MRKLFTALASALVLLGTPMSASALTPQEVNRQINKFQRELKQSKIQLQKLSVAKDDGRWNNARQALYDRVLTRIAELNDVIQQWKDKPTSA